ncbi:uncharacterized protein LOC132268565 [Cornus florida]|uniref:uncharacterized protein LOC132268565 n=1 Tax=Cornus florida TaxID=4283 RepID=UPI00289EF8F5|nr:uncharacterized protein LOC132268565 [Cornus florida]
MEDQCSPLSWSCYYQEEGIDELRHSLLYTTLELERTIVSAHEEITRKEDEIVHLKCLLTKIIKEKDEAQENFQKLAFDNKLLLQQQLQQQKELEQQQLEAVPLSGTTSNEDEPDCDENIIASPPLPPPQVAEELLPVPKKPLPEKGKFLQAVMEAGPLLQTLLLAGALPQWQHPPPQLNSIEIPPVSISSPTPRLQHQDSCCTSTSAACFSRKRGLVYHCEGSDSSPNSNYQKVAHTSLH